MSAFLCNPYHIGRIARFAADEGGSYVKYGIPAVAARVQREPDEAAPAIAFYLAGLNAESVASRYEETDFSKLPGPAPGFESEVDYQLACSAASRERMPPRIGTFEILQALRCFEYQTCEKAGWVGSPGFCAVQWINKLAIAKLLKIEEHQRGKDIDGWELRAPAGRGA